MLKRKKFITKNPKKLENLNEYLLGMFIAGEITSEQYVNYINIAMLLNRYPSWFEDLYKK